MRLWKALGLAGLAGVAATGAVVARNQRARARLGPEEIRQRLHARLGEAARAGQEAGDGPDDPGSTDSSARA